MKRLLRQALRFFQHKIHNRHYILASCSLLLALVIMACTLPGMVTRTTPDTTAPPGASPTSETLNSSSQPDDLDKAMTLDQALAVAQDDNRPQIIDKMGRPDSFEIIFADLNGHPVREDKWSYYSDNTRFDFINGALLYNINIKPMPDYSVNAGNYDPLSFEAGMSVEDVQSLLKDQQLLQVVMTDYGLTGGMLLAGDQILLGFDSGKLVYVRTFELTPEGGS